MDPNRRSRSGRSRSWKDEDSKLPDLNPDRIFAMPQTPKPPSTVHEMVGAQRSRISQQQHQRRQMSQRLRRMIGGRMRSSMPLPSARGNLSLAPLSATSNVGTDESGGPAQPTSLSSVHDSKSSLDSLGVLQQLRLPVLRNVFNVSSDGSGSGGRSARSAAGRDGSSSAGGDRLPSGGPGSAAGSTRMSSALRRGSGRLPSSTTRLDNRSEVAKHGLFVTVGSDQVRLVTGEDAIAFFARHGSDTAVKFVYCLRADTGDQYRPYDLVIVDKKDLKSTSEYITISSTGVVQVRPGEPSDVVSLADWMKHSTLFNIARSMRFFKFYLAAKMFRLWRANVRYRLYVKKRKRVQRDLFLARPAFCGPMLRMNAMLCRMEQLRLCKVSDAVASTKEFSAVQRNQTKVAFESMSKHVQDLVTLVEMVCRSVKDRARHFDISVANDDLNTSRFAQHLLGDNGRSKSMVTIKKEKADRVKHLKYAMTEVSMLPDFIRLCDYLQTEQLVRIATHNALQFFTILQQRKNPIFQTFVSFGVQSLQFAPAIEEFHSVVAFMLGDVVNKVNRVGRVLTSPAFSSFFDDRRDGRVVRDYVALIVRRDELWLDTGRQLELKIDRDFRAVEEQCKRVEDVREVYEFGQGWDQKAYEQSVDETRVAQIEADMQQLLRWKEQINVTIKDSCEAGIFQAVNSKLKAILMPITTQALSGMKDILSMRFREQCATVKDTYTDHIKRLDADPGTLSQYAGFVELFDTIQKSGLRLRERYSKIIRMHDLLSEYRVRVSERDAVVYDALKQAHVGFSKALKSATALIENRRPIWVEKVDGNIGMIETELDKQGEFLKRGVFVDEFAMPDDVLKALETSRKVLARHEATAAKQQQYQRLFNVPAHTFTSIERVLEIYNASHEFWSMFREFLQLIAKWDSADFKQLDVNEMDNKVKDYYSRVVEMHRAAGNKAATRRLKNIIVYWKQDMPLILMLGNPAMQRSHWAELYKRLFQPYYPAEKIRLRKLREIGVFEKKKDVREVCDQAVGEYELQQTLERVEATWQAEKLIVVPYRGAQDCFIIGDVDELNETLESDQSTLQNLLAGKFVAPVRSRVVAQLQLLQTVEEMISIWLSCQRKWIYLEPIFAAEDIQRQLPSEYKMFQRVDHFWRSLMVSVNKNPNVRASASTPGLSQKFADYNRDLDVIQKQLEEYLETKRANFPRFYFLSNDELIAILAQARDPRAVQPHLRKCFDNIYSLHFAEEDTLEDGSPLPLEQRKNEVLGMVSGESEYVPMSVSVFAEGNTEDWLTSVEKGMQLTMKDLVSQCVAAYPKDPTNRSQWMKDFAAQPILCVDIIMWTQAVEKALSAAHEATEAGLGTEAASRPMNALLQLVRGQIRDLVSMVRGDLEPLTRRMVSTLIVLDVHSRDVVEDLVKSGARDLNDFTWVKQMRYYWNEVQAPSSTGSALKSSLFSKSSGHGKKDSLTQLDLADQLEAKLSRFSCDILQCNAEFQYMYEYLGCPSRLVITPLTDKCYLTLTSALNYHYGGAPAGPAGTGKTESVKDLGKALAQRVLVFNCSEGLKVAEMSRMFCGLAQAGQWACFDEFNRIDIEVLSVIAQWILQIQQAVASKKATFYFEGRMMPLSKNFGVFVTMNPGYAGRTELPDNLKALFRPIAMMVPDYAQIAQIILFSEGFHTATTLSKKMVQLYQLASEQLSKQNHYDFGLRAVKSVLVMAGKLKRQFPNQREDVVLIRAMRDSNVPKFLAEDLPLFQGIISDLFPNVEVPSIHRGELEQTVKLVMREWGFVPVPAMVEKVLQLYETMVVRHGCMLVGGASVGKTVTSKVLAESLGRLASSPTAVGTYFQPVAEYRVNPKSVSMGELYGYKNNVSEEWTDGLIPRLVRESMATAQGAAHSEGAAQAPAATAEESKETADASNAVEASADDVAERDGEAEAHGKSDDEAELPSSAATAVTVPGAAPAQKRRGRRQRRRWSTTRRRLEGPSRQWLVFDGPVDSLWIENMNTVLDDSKMLCLANLERLKLSPDMSLLFEVQDLAEASPATVSRCGMVFLDPTSLGWEPVVTAWTAECADILQPLAPLLARQSDTESLLPKTADDYAGLIAAALASKLGEVSQFVEKECTRVNWQPTQSLVGACVRLLGAFLEDVAKAVEEDEVAREASTVPEGVEEVETDKKTEESAGSDNAALSNPESKTGGDGEGATGETSASGETGGEEEGGEATTETEMSALTIKDVDMLVRMSTLMATVWSFGATITGRNDRANFDKFIRKAFHDIMPTSLLPFEGTVFDYRVDVGERGFVSFAECMPEFTYDPKLPFFAMIVPTVETTTIAYLLNTLVDAHAEVLISGGTGVGKSVVVQDFLAARNQDPKAYMASIEMIFSAQTSVGSVQYALESKLEKHGKRVLGAPVGSRMVVFVDDLNMPATERYGAQPPLELLRQCIDQGGFYDKEELFFKKITGVSFIAACSPPGGGRNPLPDRLGRHFHQLWMPELPTSSINHIYTTMLGGFLEVACGHWRNEGVDLGDATRNLMGAGIELYDRLRGHMLPTPTKTHYTFNLRDLGKMVQGMMEVHPDYIPSAHSLLRCWLHESARVFRDRLVSEKDRQWFDITCQQLLQKWFGESWRLEDFKDVIFGDMLSFDDRKYGEIEDYDALLKVFSERLHSYNEGFAHEMHLVFFSDAVQHLIRIARILRVERGSALLVGVGGSGRRSLTRLAAFICQQPLFTVEVSAGFTRDDWKEQMGQMVVKCGVENQPIVFMFSDSQATEEYFLEDINSLLNSGQVPNLFDADQRDQVLAAIRQQAQEAGVRDAKRDMWDFFNERVRSNMHIVLCFSPIGNAFRQRLRQYPSLVNCMTIDWFDPWPKDALFGVADVMLRQADRPAPGSGGPTSTSNSSNSVEGGSAGPTTTTALHGISPSLREKLCQVCVRVHSTMQQAATRLEKAEGRHTYVTPTSYLELLRLYISMLGEEREKIKTKLNKYKSGMSRLESTDALVKRLKQQLLEQEPVLQRMSVETEKLLEELSVQQKEALEVADACRIESGKAQEVARQVQAMRDECKRDLDQAQPEYDAAKEALKNIERDDITLMKSYQRPPIGVVKVMDAVCILHGRAPNWEDAKRLLTMINFIDLCLDYPCDNIPKQVLKKVRKYTADPDLSPVKLKGVSTAAVGLAKWVHAIDNYAAVLKRIEPKRKSLAVAEKQLEAANQSLAERQMAQEHVEAKVKNLKAKCRAKEAKKEAIVAEMELAKVHVGRATLLTSGLGTEQKRWAVSASELERELKLLVGNVLLSAGCLSYLGPFRQQYRVELMNNWNQYCRQLNIPVSDHFSLTHTLGDPLVMREWNLSGLPEDSFSLDNGVIVSRCQRWPLCIDPQGQANRWIRRMGRAHDLSVMRMTDDGYIKKLVTAVRFGNHVLLEHVEEDLDTSIDSLLSRHVFRKGGEWKLRLADQDVVYSQNFRLYLTTKLANPHYLPDMFVKLTVVNFAVTPQGLEEQLLVQVCSIERPDLEQQRDQLLRTVSSLKRDLMDIEAKILSHLTSVQGNILDKKSLITDLAESNTTSLGVKERMSKMQTTVEEIKSVREGYRGLASKSSRLYFVVASLARVDSMYRYSLSYFSTLYRSIVERGMAARTKNGEQEGKEGGGVDEDSQAIAARMGRLFDGLCLDTYTQVSQGLFERHKLLFAFLMAVGLGRHAKDISRAEELLFIRGFPRAQAPPSTDASEENKDNVRERGALQINPCPDWLPDHAWEALCGAPSSFASIAKQLTGDQTPSGQTTNQVRAAWRTYHTVLAGCGQEVSKIPDLPAPWDTQLSGFQRLLVLKATCRQKLVVGVRRFVSEQLGARFASASPVDYNKVLDASSKLTPVVFILSPGANPMSYIMQLAQGMGMMEDRFKVLSLGQGQGPKAEELIECGSRDGDWVVLQNCHLATSWMPELERLVESLNDNAEEVHSEFRLWLTSKPSAAFPVSVLQSSVKVTLEPPRGLSKNMLRSLMDLSEETWEALTTRYSTKDSGSESKEGGDGSGGSGGSEPQYPHGWDSRKLSRHYKKLLYATTFFHAVCQERRKFGPIGWNIPYKWMRSDLEMVITILRVYMEQRKEVPWTTLFELVADVHYGGRVTDDKDMRLVKALLRRFYTAEVDLPGYQFMQGSQAATSQHQEGVHDEMSVGDLQVVTVPSSIDSLHEVRAHVAALPEESPGCFGLHPNASVTFWLSEARKLTDTMLSMQPKETGSGNADSDGGDGAEEKSAQEGDGPSGTDREVLRLMEQFESKLPKKIESSGERVNERTFAGVYEGTNTRGVFLHHEIVRFNRLLAVIHDSLHRLRQAIYGLMVMSEPLEAMYQALLFNMVPKEWETAAYPSTQSLAVWVADLGDRVAEMQGWVDNGPPDAFWLSGYYFPQGFITAIKQEYARATEIPIDSLRLRTTVMPGCDSEKCPPPDRGVYVRGLFLQSAAWDGERGQLKEEVDGVLFDALPWVWLEPVTLDEYESSMMPGGSQSSNVSDLASNVDGSDEGGETEEGGETDRGEEGDGGGESKTSVVPTRSHANYYRTPMYKTTLRRGQLSTTGHSTNFVMYIDLPSAVPEEFWVLRGAATVLARD